jgi:hypothetical protein
LLYWIIVVVFVVAVVAIVLKPTMWRRLGNRT